MSNDNNPIEHPASVKETPIDDWFESIAEFDPPARGEIRDATVVAATPRDLRLDIGGKSDGVLSDREMAAMPGARLAELQVGQQLQVFVVNPQDNDGNTIVSLQKVEEALEWSRVGELFDNRQTIDVEIVDCNKGGLLVQLGHLRAFLPGSQVDTLEHSSRAGSTPEERWNHLLGETAQVKVIEVDRDRNRLVVSEQAAVREVRQKAKEQLMATLQEGEVLSGRIASVLNFGAFVDLGGADGLIHLSELSWIRVKHPREVVSVGDEVQVYVLNVDLERQRIGLSLKRMEPDPWGNVEERCTVGALVEGTITNLTKFGAFARVHDLDGIEGLIHISELSNEFIEHPSEAVETGQQLTLRVILVDGPGRRLSLSIRQVESDEYRT